MGTDVLNSQKLIQLDRSIHTIIDAALLSKQVLSIPNHNVIIEYTVHNLN